MNPANNVKTKKSEKSDFFQDDSQSSNVMRETGLEPVRCEPHAPQTCASASSATLALLSAYRRQRYLLYYRQFDLSIHFLDFGEKYF